MSGQVPPLRLRRGQHFTNWHSRSQYNITSRHHSLIRLTFNELHK
jgi:hypothetical protein